MSQVQAFALLFQQIDHPQTLTHMMKASGCQFGQNPLASMAKGGMAQVMRQRNGLCQIFVQAQCPGNGASNLGHFQGMRQPGSIVVPLGRQKNLSFIFQTAEGLTMQDTIAIMLKNRTDRTQLSREKATSTL